MPGVAETIVAVVTWLGTATTVAAAVARFALTAAVSTILAKKSADFDPGLQSRNLTTRGTVEPQKLIYGEVLVSGPLAAPPQTAGIRNRDLWNVIILAGHEVDSITDIYLDSEVITNAQINGGAAAGGDVTTGTFGPVRSQNVCQIFKHYGTATQTNNTALTAAVGSSTWSTNHRLRGLAYLVTKFSLWDRTERIWEAGEPRNVRALVRGKIIYDPRLDTSPGANPDNAAYFAWSDNPALCAADFLRDTKFGPSPAVPAARIDWDDVVTAANECDVLVPVPTGATEKRFTCNGVLYGSATPQDNLNGILSSMNGETVFANGIYHIYAGTYRAPTDTLTADEIVGPITMRRSRPASERVNTMKASYVDREKNWEPTETLPKTIAAYVARDDDDVLEENLDLPFTSKWYEAQRLVQKKLTESNQERSLSIPCSLKAARFMAGDRINFEFPERGWSPKVFKVLGWRLNWRENLTVTLDLIEDDAAAYADPVEGDYNTRTVGGGIVEVSPEPIPGIDSIPRTGLGHYGEGSWNLELFANNQGGVANDGEIYITAGDFLLPDGTLRTYANTDVLTPYEGATTPPDGIFYLVSGVSGFYIGIYDRTRESWYVVDNANNETLRNGTGELPANDYVVARGIKTSVSGGIDSLTSLITFVEDPQASAGAQAGVNLLNEAGDILSDIDISNDQIVVFELGAINANPTVNFARRLANGNVAPASWLGDNTTTSLGYMNAAVRDILYTGAGVVNTAFRVNPETEYEIVAFARVGSGDVTNVSDITVMELNSELAEGEYAIGNAATGEAGVTLGDAAIDIGLTNMALTTAFQAVIGTYTPSAAALWASVRLGSGSGVSELQIKWLVVREKSTLGATLGDNLRAENGLDVITDLLALNSFANRAQLAGDLSTNPFMTIPNVETDSPLGILAGYGNGTQEHISYADADRTILAQGSGGTDSSTGMIWPAFRITTGQRYRVFIRWRLVAGSIASNGLYMRFLHKNGAIAQGSTHIGYNSVSSNPLIDEGSALPYNSGNSTCEVISDTNGVGVGADYENRSVTALNTWYETVLEYAPDAAAEWASFCILNWTGLGASSEIEIDSCFIFQAATFNTGALADQDTVDWQTDVSGTGIPDDNATVGAEAGLNFVTQYNPGTERLLESTASRTTTSTTYQQLADSFQLEGTGSVRIYYDGYSTSDVTVPESPIQIQFRQGATVLATVNRYGIGTWTTSLLTDVTLVSSDPIDVYVRSQDGTNTGGVRNVEIAIGAMGNGEAIV